MGCGASTATTRTVMSSSSSINNNTIVGDGLVDTRRQDGTIEETMDDKSCTPCIIGVNPPPSEGLLLNEDKEDSEDEEKNDDDEEEVPLYDPRFRRLSHAECDSRRESLMHEVAERHSRRPSIQFALNENEVTEIPYETVEGADIVKQDNNNEDDEEEEEEDESFGLSPTSESDDIVNELPSTVTASNDGRRRSLNHEPRRRSSLEMCSIESKAEHELREREIAHRKQMEKAATDGEPHVDFDVKVEVETYEVPKVALTAAPPNTTVA